MSIRKDYLMQYNRVNPIDAETNLKRLKTTLWSLNIITLIIALYDLYIVSKIFGGLTEAFVFGNLLYRYRVLGEGLPGSIPYSSSLVFTAALLAGNYTARVQKLTLVGILPFIIIIMIDFAIIGRADILIVGILFTSAYFLTQTYKTRGQKKIRLSPRKLGILVIAAAILVGGAESIRSIRQVKEEIKGSTSMLKTLSTARVITPSIYLYLSSDYGVLNKYILKGGENTPIGGHTFLPLYRIFERLGFDVHAQAFQKWYKTPVSVNTGTYLRELHGDFGITGLLFGPYLIGVFSSIFWFRIREHGRYTDLAIAVFFYTIIGMSFFVMATRISPFFFYFFVSIIIGYFLDKKSSANTEYYTRAS
jgi:oligosaccharide repeat unit polymerase